MDTVTLSDFPLITFRLGSPSVLRWEDDTGYFELEAGSLSLDSCVVTDLREFWAGKWTNWSYGEHNERHTLTIEMDRIGDIVKMRLDYHHMNYHLGVDRSVIVSKRSALS